MDPETIVGVGRVPHGSSDDPSLLDFSANTNPRTPDGVAQVYVSALDDAQTYPSEPPQKFRTAAADYLDCNSEKIIPTPGGLAAIRLAIGLALDIGGSALVPVPSFSEYAREVRLAGGEPVFVPHDTLLDADPENHALAIVCNPNNPTGEAYEPEALREFATRCRESDTLLLCDEAFLDFIDQPSLAGTDGVVVARSLTKLFGLPGLRMGFAVATGTVRDALATRRRPWNVGMPALAVGTHCLGQDDFIAETRERVHEERTKMREALATEFAVYPSDAPFLLLDVGARDPSKIVANAREHGIAIRDATTFRRLDSHIRVAVRLPEENDRILEVLCDS